MISALLDTHAFVWLLSGDSRLSQRAHNFILNHLQQGNLLAVPSISIVEIVYLEEKNKIPPVFVANLEVLFTRQNYCGDGVGAWCTAGYKGSKDTSERACTCCLVISCPSA